MAIGLGLNTAAIVLIVLCGPAALAIAVGAAVAWRFASLRKMADTGCHRAPHLRVFGVPALWDSLAYGLRYGGWCALSCWPLMLAPLTASREHVAVMAVCAVVMVIDRYRPGSYEPAAIKRTVVRIEGQEPWQKLLKRLFCRIVTDQQDFYGNNIRPVQLGPKVEPPT
jgi:predicted metal-binding membrane protein